MPDVLQRIEQKIDAMSGRLEVVEGDLSSVRVSLKEVKSDLTGVKADLSGLIDTVHKQGALQEEMRDDIKQTLEGVIFLREATGRRFDEVITKLDERVQPIELATRYLATKMSRE